MFQAIVDQVVKLQSATVQAWHQTPIELSQPVQEIAAAARRDLPSSSNDASSRFCRGLIGNLGFLEVVCRQHSYNYLLWHEEDVARSPSATDTQIAQVKRSIDRYNQQRNDWIERTDDWLTQYFEIQKVVPQADAIMNTETPGSTFDRLSILSLRLYHLREELSRTDASAEHRIKVQQKLQVCEIQQAELGQALANLLGDIYAGRKRHRTYRQCKMYNDPTLNPAIYRANRPAKAA
ncbi:MAG: DUF4254 domain-containing protein [Planctomycetaceae bacterium]|nr:DUF4254 domain-containing protein [Planctomycetaceae bacterium]